MAERRYGEKAPKTDATIAGADWYGRQIERERHENILFVDLDLTEGQTVGVVFHECTFRRARFNASSHQASAFVNCTFVSCKFFDSRFTECKFVGSMFDACEFDQMQVSGGDWSFVGLPGAILGRAAFKGTRLREADLTGASCKGGSLRDVDLSGAWLHGADLSACDLRGSDLSAIEPENVRLREAIITIDQTIVIAEALGLQVRLK
jgi:fluoroquinolone resistance protein